MDIPVSFAVITSGQDQATLAAIAASVAQLDIPQADLMIIGGAQCSVQGRGVRHIAFNEAQTRAGWITRKKNLATLHARHEVIVYFHDYHVFDAGWYEAFCRFGTDWDICMHQVQAIDGTRFFGWQMYDHPTVPRYFNVPWHRHDLMAHMYLSGGYFVAKRGVMLAAPLDESLVWGQSEDVEWSMRVRERFTIRANPGCIVRHTKRHTGLEFCHTMASLEPRFDAYLALAGQAPAEAAAAATVTQGAPA